MSDVNDYKTYPELLGMDWTPSDFYGDDIYNSAFEFPDSSIFSLLDLFSTDELENNHGEEMCPNNNVKPNPNSLSVSWSTRKKHAKTLFRNSCEMIKKICMNCQAKCSANSCSKCKLRNDGHLLDHDSHGGTCTLSFRFTVPKDFKDMEIFLRKIFML